MRACPPRPYHESIWSSDANDTEHLPVRGGEPARTPDLEETKKSPSDTRERCTSPVDGVPHLVHQSNELPRRARLVD